jgi:LysR family transcriptional activator of nhaA
MNFKHLHYFWVAAKAGGVVRRASSCTPRRRPCPARSSCWKTAWAGHLFRKSGRKLELTDDGRVALRYADEIFALGNELEAALREWPRSGQQVLEFRVGIEDAVAKSVAYRLLEPALQLAEPVRLVCTEGPLQRPDGAAGAAPHGPGDRRRAAQRA